MYTDAMAAATRRQSDAEITHVFKNQNQGTLWTCYHYKHTLFTSIRSNRTTSHRKITTYMCCSMQSHKYTRGKRKTFQSFTGQPQRHSTRQNKGNQKHSFVTAHNETIASVSYHNIPLSLKKTITLSFSFFLLSSHKTVNKTQLANGHKSNSSLGFKITMAFDVNHS